MQTANGCCVRCGASMLPNETVCEYCGPKITNSPVTTPSSSNDGSCDGTIRQTFGSVIVSSLLFAYLFWSAMAGWNLMLAFQLGVTNVFLHILVYLLANSLTFLFLKAAGKMKEERVIAIK